jgi:cytochrome P450
MGLLARLKRLPGQLSWQNPFPGSRPVERLPVIRTGLVTFRYFRTPIRILDALFGGPDDDQDLKYLDVPGFPPILFVRDPEVIRAVTVETANQGAFDRDTLPTQGIARVVGTRNLLYAQGDLWRKHRAAAAKPFGTGAVQTEHVFHDMEDAIRRAVEPQLDALEALVRQTGANRRRMRLEPHIKAVMLNVLVNVLFGCPVSHAELQQKYLPAIENVIRYIMLDTVANVLHVPVCDLPALTARHAQLKADRRTFEELVNRVVACRKEGTGFWPLLTAEGPEEALRSNVRVFLAGALEATASYISWALGSLARHPAAREKAYREAAAQTELTPAAREGAVYLQKLLTESVRLNNSLYFLPRIAVRDASVKTSQGVLNVPAGTHLVLATYHANRCERYWGEAVTGDPAAAFVPERWDVENLAARGLSSKDVLHFGFGHGTRVCIGKHFSEAEAFVCLTLFLRRFEFTAVRPSTATDAGISTRPRDGVEVDLSLRFFRPQKAAAHPA